MGLIVMAFNPTADRISALQRTLELQDSMKREGSERNEFMGRMDDAIYHGRAPGSPLDYLYPSGRFDVNAPPGEKKVEEVQGTPRVWEPPHYRRPWDSVPIGAIADPYAIMGDPRFHPQYGYGLNTQVQRSWRNEAGIAPAPRYPFEHYGIAEMPFDPALFPLGYDPLLSSAKAANDAVHQNADTANQSK